MKHLLGKPDTANAKTLASLAAAFADEGRFPLGSRQALDVESFDLAIRLMQDWRLYRYCAARTKLRDLVLRELFFPRRGAGGSTGCHSALLHCTVEPFYVSL
jgi:hypothetical protein